MDEAKDADKHPIMHRTVPLSPHPNTHNSYQAQNSADVEKPCLDSGQVPRPFFMGQKYVTYNSAYNS